MILVAMSQLEGGKHESIGEGEPGQAPQGDEGQGDDTGGSVHRGMGKPGGVPPDHGGRNMRGGFPGADQQELRNGCHADYGSGDAVGRRKQWTDTGSSTGARTEKRAT